MYITADEPLPTASPAQPDEAIVPLSARGMAKAPLYEAMREQGINRAELARRLGIPRAPDPCTLCNACPNGTGGPIHAPGEEQIVDAVLAKLRG